MITFESCFTGKVSTYSCKRTMREYVHGLFTTDVQNWTSNCTQLYFVDSIRKNCVLTGGTGSYCNGGLHPLFTSCSAWFKICFLDFIMIKKCCGNELFYKSWWILRIKFLDCQTNKTVNIWNIWKLFVVMEPIKLKKKKKTEQKQMGWQEKRQVDLLWQFNARLYLW